MSLMIFDQQFYDGYTMKDQATWSRLFMRQMLFTRMAAYRHFRGNQKKLGLTSVSIPEIKTVNEKLEKITGWNIYTRPEQLTDSAFFHLLNARQFGVNCSMPDIFFDSFGFAALLADPVIAPFLLNLSRASLRHKENENAISDIRRLYRATVARGLVKEVGVVKIFGGELLASEQEGRFAVSYRADQRPFDLTQILNSDATDEKTFFVLDSLGQLKGIIKEFDHLLKTRYP
jgi:phenylalanine-4-hydroxylase